MKRNNIHLQEIKVTWYVMLDFVQVTYIRVYSEDNDNVLVFCKGADNARMNLNLARQMYPNDRIKFGVAKIEIV
jgi:hypothetical protein